MTRNLEFRDRAYQLRRDYLEDLDSHIGLTSSIALKRQEITALQDEVTKLRSAGFHNIPHNSQSKRNTVARFTVRADIAERELARMTDVEESSAKNLAQSEQQETDYYNKHQGEYYQMAVDWALGAGVRVMVAGEAQLTTVDLEAAQPRSRTTPSLLPPAQCLDRPADYLM